MLIYAYIIISILGLLVRRSKLLTLLIFAFAWILMWNDTTGDHANYEIIYNNNDFRDYGYSVLCQIFSWLGFEYLTFKLIISAVVYWIFYRFVNKYAYYNALVAALYLLFLCYLDVNQFRNFVAFAIYLFAVPYLFKDRLSDKITYSVIVLLATLIHASMLFYIIFLVVNKESLSSLKGIVYNVLSLGVLAIVMLLFVDLDVNDRLDQYSATTSMFTKMALVVMFVANYIYVYLYSRRKDRYLDKGGSIEESKMTNSQMIYIDNKAAAIIFVNIAIFIILPLAFGSLSFARLYRFLALLNFIYVTNIIRLNPRFYDILGLIIYASSFLVLVYFMHIDSILTGMILPILYLNLLFPIL